MKHNKYRIAQPQTFKTVLTTFVILLSVYLSYYPVFHGNAWWGHDWLAHLNRVQGTLGSLQHGQFPPYFDNAYQDYPGYSWNLFYPPLFNWLATPIQYVTQDYNITIKIITTLIGCIAARCAYLLFYLLNREVTRALILSLCYACSLYLVDNIFIRFALPESLALAFFPLLVAGLLEPDPKQSFKKLIIANTFIFLANIPAAISVMLFILLYFGFHYRQFDTIMRFIKAYVIAILLCAWFIFPLLYTMLDANFPMANTNYFTQTGVFIVDLYNFISGDIIRRDPLRNMVLGLGYPVFFAFIFCLWKAQSFSEKNTLILLTLVFFITTPVNYSFLPEVFSLFSKIQFSWRLIPFTVILILLEINRNHHINTNILVLILALTALMSTSITITTYKNLPAKKDLNAATAQFTQVSYTDYVLTEATQKKETISPTHLPCQNGDKHFTVNYTKTITTNGLPAYTFDLPENASCTIPYLAYKPLYLKNVEDYQYDGFFQAQLAKGQHIVTIGVKRIFQFLLFISLLIALTVLCLLNKHQLVAGHRKLR